MIRWQKLAAHGACLAQRNKGDGEVRHARTRALPDGYALFSIGAPTLLPHSVQEPS
jgi:hypothetical protein